MANIKNPIKKVPKTPKNNNQGNVSKVASTDKPKKATGGYRPGAGRKKGSVNKITATEFFDEYKKQSGSDYIKDFVERTILAHDMITTSKTRTQMSEAIALANKIDSMLSRLVFSQVQEVDVTSKGSELKALTLNIVQTELPEWKE